MVAALVWSVTWTAPPDNRHASHVSSVPKPRSRSAAPGVLASSHATLVADWFGASDSPWSALATMHSVTVRRSCQPSAGPTGVAGHPVPHHGRGPLVGDADGGDRAGARPAPPGPRRSPRPPPLRRRTRPGPGRACRGGSPVARCRRWRGSSSTMAARSDVVPTSITSTVLTGAPDRSGGSLAHDPSCCRSWAGTNPRWRRRWPSTPPSSPASATTLRLKKMANQCTSLPGPGARARTRLGRRGRWRWRRRCRG